MNKEKFVIANWKMKLSNKESVKLAKEFVEKMKTIKKGNIVVCPSFLELNDISKIFKKSNISLGALNVFWEECGAFTGEVSPSMLIESGCKYVVIGHSERRKYLLENYDMIHKKVKAVLNTGILTPIICIGESLEERKTDRRDYVLVDQLQQALCGLVISPNQRVIVAYEPVWAIGSGFAIEPEEAVYAHKIIKLALNDTFGVEVVKNNISVVYGGSIDSKNIKDFVNAENIDGVLVGGASLDTNEFYKIAKVMLK